MTCLDSLKPYMLSFMFETVAGNANASLYGVGAAASYWASNWKSGRFFDLLQGLLLPLLSLLPLSNRKDKLLHVFWWQLGHGLAKAPFCNFC